MGSSQSAPPPSPTFRDPWRKVSWGDRAGALQYVNDYQPENEDVKHLRVLLYGPVGAGKSSFISSVSSTLRGQIATPAFADAYHKEQSFTKTYKTHKISKGGRGNYYSVVFNDVMGLEEGSGNGVGVEDLTLALKGHVKEGYKFNPVSPLSCDDPGFNPSPSPDDRVHALVWVGSANTSALSDSVLQKMRAIRAAASNLRIPQLALATKVDEACGETEKDLKNVYRSKHLKSKMTDFSTTLGIPLNCILPVKNYSEETEVDNDVDCLILSAVKMIINLGNDFINEM